MLLVALAGITSFVFCLVIFFVFFYLDRSVRDARQLANITGVPVIGQLNKLNDKMLNLEDVWNKTGNSSKSVKKFKTQLRSIRFEIDNYLQSSKIIAITSLGANEGKTFFALNLAYAYGMINKKVLIIDGNFEDAEITSITQPHLFVEDFLHERDADMIYDHKNPTVFGNRGEDVSLLEINDQVSLRTKLGTLHDNYDIILLEIPSLNAHNKAKEWISFADKVIAVYANGQSMDDTKKENIAYLKNLNGKLMGWIFNMVKEKRNQKL
jgi:Mrp family chromosome partitioning ATPase